MVVIAMSMIIMTMAAVVTTTMKVTMVITMIKRMTK